MHVKRAFLSLTLSLVISLFFSPVCLGAEKSIKLPDDNAMAKLKPGPNVEIVRRNCVACHSTDYIVLQPRGDAKHWETEVRKMVTVFGAPISEADTKGIVEYLATAYGARKTEGKKQRAESSKDKRR